jgi:hypothetical protein
VLSLRIKLAHQADNAMPRPHLDCSAALMTAVFAAVLAAVPALGQQPGTLYALAKKVCELGTRTQKDEIFEQLGLDAPFMFAVEPMHPTVAVSAGTCSNSIPRADAPLLGIRRLIEATAPGEAAFIDDFTMSGGGELIAGVRRDFTVKIITRLDVTEPDWRAEVADAETYWLNKYGLQSR